MWVFSLAGTVLAAINSEVDVVHSDPKERNWLLSPFHWTYGLEQLDVDFLMNHIHDLKQCLGSMNS
jgi:hypothetical protein